MTNKRLLIKTGRFFLYLLTMVLAIVIGTWIFINTNYGKDVVTNKVHSYLEKKLKTKVLIGSIDYSLPKWIEINGIYIEDRAKDTLLYGEKLSVDLDMFKLLSGTTYIRKVELQNTYVNMYRGEKDTAFNFQFIVDAFSGNKPTNKVDLDTANLKLTLKHLLLNNVFLRFNDKFSGNVFTARIKDLDATLSRFQPERLLFDIDAVSANGVDYNMTIGKNNTPKRAITDSSIVYALGLTAKKLDLREINIIVDNSVNSMYYSSAIKHLMLTRGLLTVVNGRIVADSLLLDSSKIRFVAPSRIIDKLKDSLAVMDWSIALNTMRLNNNEFQFENNSLPPQPGFDPAHFNMQQIYLSADQLNYTVDSSAIKINHLSFWDKSGLKIDTTHGVLSYGPGGIDISELYLKTPQSLLQNSFSLIHDRDDLAAKDKRNSKVSARLFNSTIAVKDLYLVAPSVKNFLPPADFGNDLIRLNTELRGNLQQLYIPYLQLVGFSGTRLNARAILYNVNDKNRFRYDITILNSTIPRRDLAKFLPASGREALSGLPELLQINTHIRGNMQNTNADLNFSSNTLRYLGSIELKNFNRPAALQYNLKIRESRIARSLLISLIPKGKLPPNLRLPQTITASGTLTGNANNLNPNLRLGGSYGSASIKGAIRNIKSNSPSYDLALSGNNFALGKLLMQDSILGNISFSGTAKGAGFDYKTMQSVIRANIKQIRLKNYNFQGINIRANLDRGNISSEGMINDPNLVMQYNTTANVSGRYPVVNGRMRIDTARLKQLGLYSDTLNFSMNAAFNSNSLEPRNLEASFLLDSILMEVNNKNYALDTVSMIGTTKNGITDITVRSPMADLAASGAFDYDQVGKSILQYVDRFYDISPIPPATIPNQEISFSGIIKKHPLIVDLVPGLKAYEDINFSGSYFSAYNDSALNLTATIPYLSYQDYLVRNGRALVNSRNEKINYDINFDTLGFKRQTLFATRINGYLANDSLDFYGTTKDQNNTDRFAIGASLAVDGNGYSFSLKDNLLLNYQKWNVAPGNRIQYGKKGVLVNNFELSNGTAKITANSKVNALNSPVDIVISNFNIRDITTLLNQDTLLASGVVNGNFTLSDFNKVIPGFTGNLDIAGLEYKQQPVGNIKLNAQKIGENTINATLGLTGNGNALTAIGNYYLNNSEKQFDADLKIDSLSIKTLQSFSAGAIQNASGSINGQVKLDGKFSDPHWSGYLGFDSAKFGIAKLGTRYGIDGQSIALNYPTLGLSNFTITDSANNKLILDGSIYSRSLTAYDLSLNAKATDFILLDAPKNVNDQLFGYAAVDANINITGTSAEPMIEGALNINDESNITVVLPEANINKDAAMAIVRFIDRDTFALPEHIPFEPANAPKVDFARFLNYNLNISTSRNAVLTVVIDPATGDELKVQGDALLNAGVDPSGRLVLSGNYELFSGSYVFNYQFIQKKFDLVKGSTISFGGDPKDAQIDISAEYITNTPARDLIQNEVGDITGPSATAFGQKLPFRILLRLQGTLQKPVIKFDIQLADDNTAAINGDLRSAIENKLAQLQGDEAAMNKQVFSLLVLNRFTGEQSTDFFKGNGVNFNDLTRQSVSGFLSSALNQIASDLFKGLDVDLNLTSYQDYNSNQRTDLTVAVTKTFMDDRLSISVGKNFGIEGEEASTKTNQKSSNTFMPDVTVNYKLTKDGKYMLRAYTKNQYEVLLDGYVVETGVAFILTMDYDKFRELFTPKKNRKAANQ